MNVICAWLYLDPRWLMLCCLIGRGRVVVWRTLWLTRSFCRIHRLMPSSLPVCSNFPMRLVASGCRPVRPAELCGWCRGCLCLAVRSSYGFTSLAGSTALRRRFPSLRLWVPPSFRLGSFGRSVCLSCPSPSVVSLGGKEMEKSR